jgi:hypothetical protein
VRARGRHLRRKATTRRGAGPPRLALHPPVDIERGARTTRHRRSLARHRRRTPALQAAGDGRAVRHGQGLRRTPCLYGQPRRAPARTHPLAHPRGRAGQQQQPSDSRRGGDRHPQRHHLQRRLPVPALEDAALRRGGQRNSVPPGRLPVPARQTGERRTGRGYGYRAVQSPAPTLSGSDHRRHRLPDRPGHRLCAQGEPAVGTALASPPQSGSLRVGPRIPRHRAGGGKRLA